MPTDLSRPLGGISSPPPGYKCTMAVQFVCLVRGERPNPQKNTHQPARTVGVESVDGAVGGAVAGVVRQVPEVPGQGRRRRGARRLQHRVLRRPGPRPPPAFLKTLPVVAIHPPPREVGCSQLGVNERRYHFPLRPTRRAQRWMQLLG